MTSSLTGLLHNQLVGGGLVLMVTGSILALMKETPKRVAAWFRRRVTVEVEVLNSDPLFDYVTLWLDKQPYSKRSRRLTAVSASRVRDDEDDDYHYCQPVAPDGKKKKSIKVLLSPAPGFHVFRYGGSIIWLERNRDRSSAPQVSGGSKGQGFAQKPEQYNITVLGRRQQVIRDLLEEIVINGSPDSDAIRLFSSSFGYWKSTGVISPRKIDSVVLPAGVAEVILEDAKLFLKSAEWYRNLGIPWHRGYLFWGKAGSGKTSIVAALAGELHMNLYLLNIAGAGMDDEKLVSLMSDVRPGSIVLLEDIDCTVPDRDQDKESRRVTLSGMLNCLDGVQSTEGCLVFMTTNRRDVLDSALTRPGRVDVELEFGIATQDQILRLRDRIVPGYDSSDLLDECRGMTMAEVQGALLAKRENKTEKRLLHVA